MKKFSILLVIAALILTSCGGKPEETTLVSYGTELFDPNIAYDEFIDGCAGDTDGKVYLAVNQINDEAEPHSFIYSIGEDGMPQKILSGDSYLEDGISAFVQIQSLQADSGGSLWLTGRAFGGGLAYETYDFLWCIDGTGESKEKYNLTKITAELPIEKIDGAVMDSSKWLYLVSGESVFALNHWQKYQFTLDAGKNAVPVRFGDGGTGFFISDGETDTIRTIDQETQDWGQTYELPENCSAVYPGNRDYLFFCNAGGTLQGWNAETGSFVPLMNWLDTGINTSALLGFSIQEDGKIIGPVYENLTAQIAVLTPGAENVEKTVLTLVGVGSDYYIRKYVAEFNRTSTTCRIVYKTYYRQTGAWFSEGEYKQGLQRLMTEIAAGDVPDLLDIDDLPFQRYGTLGMLEDLWPYIENDPELGRAGVMEHVLECAEQDGKLYTVFNTFSMGGVVGAKSVAGDRLGWTFEEFLDLFESMPEGTSVFWPETAKIELLYDIVTEDLDSYIDWETGTCSFDSEDFKTILSFCNTAGAEIGDPSYPYLSYYRTDEPQLLNSLIADRKMMLHQLGLWNFMALQSAEKMFGEEVSFIGYPTRDGSYGSSFGVGSTVAMTSACKDKEGAWEFLRMFLLEQPEFKSSVDYFNTSFPVNRKGFEYLWEMSSTPEYLPDGTEIPKFSEGGYGYDGSEVLDYLASPQRHYDQVMEIYNATNSITWDDDDLWNIVSEQAQVYFAGDRSLDETAKMIQNRAELYVSERM